MTQHRFFPVAMAYDEEERGPLWRCPCGTMRTDPTPRLTDDCNRLELLEDEP